MRKLYVGNLNYRTTEEQLRMYFEAVGPVEKVEIITDRETQRPRGFGFVTMGTEAHAKTAIERYDGQDFEGRRLVVNEAREKERRGGRGDDRGGDRRWRD
jgi:cold-inducible RNA-binding protein